MDILDMQEISGEMAELDLCLPFQAFMKVLDEADISDEQHEGILSGLSEQFAAFRANQNEYYQKVYSA